MKWKAGVSSFLLECHLLPVLVRRPEPSQGHRNLGDKEGRPMEL